MSTTNEVSDQEFATGIINFFGDVQKLPENRRKLALNRVEKFARLVAEGNEEIAALDVKHQCGILDGGEWYEAVSRIVDAA